MVFIRKSQNSFPAEPRLIAALRAAIPPSGSPPACPVGSRSDSFGDRWTKPVKIETFFRGHVQKIFSIKESIFAGFASLLTPVVEQSSLRGTAQGGAASHPSRSFGAESRRAKIPFPRPLFLFARLLGQSLSRIIPKGFVRGPQIFFGGGKILKQKGWWMGLER